MIHYQQLTGNRIMDKPKRRKSPKSAMATKKVTIVIPEALDAHIYALAEQEYVGISEMYACLLQEALDHRARQG